MHASRSCLFLLNCSPDDQPHSIPVVVTLITERGQGDQTLLTGVRNQLGSLKEQISIEITVTAVSRFGKKHIFTSMIVILFIKNSRWLSVKLYHHSFSIW